MFPITYLLTVWRRKAQPGVFNYGIELRRLLLDNVAVQVDGVPFL